MIKLDITPNLQCLEQVLKLIEDDIIPHVEMNSVESLGENLMLYTKLDDLKDSVGKITKAINKIHPTIARRVHDNLTALNLDEIVVDGYKYKPTEKLQVNVSEANKQRFIEWMKAHPIGCEYVKEDVHPATLTKFIKEHVLPNGEVLPDGVSTFDVPTLEVRKMPRK